MNRRAFLSQAVLTTALIALTASTAAAQTGTRTRRLHTRLPRRPRRFAGQPGAVPRSTGVDHDSDAQLDVWVQRCNDADGGMVTADDGNYECHDSSGNPIHDW